VSTRPRPRRCGIRSGLFVLGHTVLGSELVLRIRKQLPLAWLVVGTVLPDLIDKPVYYGLTLATGRRGAELGLISGTRTFGHTGILLLLLVAVALISRAPRVAALAWGTASHLALDLLSDVLRPHIDGPGGIHAVLFPLLGPHFPVAHSQNVGDHVLLSLGNWSIALAELLGASLLAWRLVALRRRRRRSVAAP
jgi:hypothetical protein